MRDVTMALRLTSSADGWRGIIGEGFTPEATGALAGCVVRALTPAGEPPTVLVTYDGRRGGPPAADAVRRAAQAAGAGQVRVVPHLPTPTATAAVRLGFADLALLVTASHNPAQFNGVKVKVRPGCPLPRDVERLVDTMYETESTGFVSEVVGASKSTAELADQLTDQLIDEHIADVLSRLPFRPSRRLLAVVDGLGGVAGEATARLCRGLNWDVTVVAGTPDPDFAGLVPDPSLPASRVRVAEHVRTAGADLGVVLDGDGDRIYVVDHRGRSLQSHELFALLVEHRHRRSYDLPEAGIAVTAATGTAARWMARALGRPVTELGVGFKHLSPMLSSGQVDAAGGGVGDMCFAEFGVDRDPFAVLVLLADLLDPPGRTLADLLDGLDERVGGLRYLESRVDGAADDDTLLVLGHQVLTGLGLGPVGEVTTMDGVKFWLGAGQWLLLRTSSTEGGVRIYGEFGGPAADARAAELVDAVGRGLAAGGVTITA
jgi:phosphomannomutase